jgi:hypothetical protein
MGEMETVAMMIGDYSVGLLNYFIVKLAGSKIIKGRSPSCQFTKINRDRFLSFTHCDRYDYRDTN